MASRSSTKKSRKTETKEEKKLHVEILERMLMLSTAGFGLVAALAWNNLIQQIIKTYIEPYLPRFGEVFTLLVYAIVVTVLAVVVTVQLSKLLEAIKRRQR